MQDFDTWSRSLSEKYAPFDPADISTPEKCYRVMTLDCTRAQDDQRTVEATLSTESPVMRGGYREILSHEETAVNLERAKDGALPLLWSHDQEQLIGSAENIRVHGSRLRARLRFSESRRGEEIWQDVKAGHVRGISIGYVIEKSDDPNTGESRGDLLATRWMPFEASCVSVPADTSAGIGRALESGSLRELPEDVAVLDHQYRLRNHLDGLTELAEKYEGKLDEKLLAIAQNRIMSVKTDQDAEKASEAITAAFDEYTTRQEAEAQNASPSTGQWRNNPMETQFSLCRALAMTFDPNSARQGGPEYEIMQDAARHRGKSIGERYTLPEEALFRAVTKGGDGGNTIGVEHLAGQFVPALRERLITGRMGATIMPGLIADVQIPRSTSDSSAGWIAGDGSDAVSASDPSYDKISMSPTTVGCYTTLSRKMLLQADPSSEQLVRDSLSAAVAKALDTAAINGSGSSNQPLGIMGQTGVASSTYANGGAASFGDIVDLEGDLMVDDADMGNLGYVTTAAMSAKLKQTDIGTDTGQMIWTADGEGQGRMNGYRAMTSNLIPAGYILFGNWSDLLVGLWSGLDFVVDPFSRASYGDVIITIYQDADIAVRHGESFAEIHEAAP